MSVLLCFICLFITVLDLATTTDSFLYPDDPRLRSRVQEDSCCGGSAIHSRQKEETYPVHDAKEPPDEDLQSTNGTRLPLEFVQKLNDMETDDILAMIEGYNDAPQIGSRFGEERRAGHTARNAKCMPEMHTVRLLEERTENMVVIPECTRVERCGGCCQHNLLSCQPTEIDYIPVEVVKAQYNLNGKLKYTGKEVIQLERHQNCKCQCKIKEEDCNRDQRYEKRLCQCVCRNPDDEQKCYRSEFGKQWNSETCSCVCKDVYECTTGEYFDNETCRCKLLNLKRGFLKTHQRTKLEQFNDDI